MSYSVLLPTLNENGHIIKLINRISKIFLYLKTDYEIIVIDDNSTDGTLKTVKKFVKNNKSIQLKIITRQNKRRSLPDSLNEGIRNSKCKYLIWLDADFQHPPIYIKKLIYESSQSDVIICSRFLKKSKRYFHTYKNYKDTNENQSFLFNKLCQKFFFSDISDFTSGFICIKKKIIKDYKLDGYYGDYFLNLICFLKFKNVKIKEIPFNDSIRATGTSKTLENLNVKYLYLCSRYLLTFLKNFIKIFFYKIKKIIFY